MQIGVAYAEADQHIWLSIEVPKGSTVQEGILRSGILARFPGIDLDKQKVGIFGKITKLNGTLNEGDRIEIYRPITVDPKTVPQRKFDADDDDDDD